MLGTKSERKNLIKGKTLTWKKGRRGKRTQSVWGGVRSCGPVPRGRKGWGSGIERNTFNPEAQWYSACLYKKEEGGGGRKAPLSLDGGESFTIARRENESGEAPSESPQR